MFARILKSDQIADFVAFCLKHREKIDNSFLYDEDLEEFKPDDENPTCIITDNAGTVVAAASLILDEYNRRGRKGRFRIFYSEVDDPAYYSNMLQFIKENVSDIDNVYLFVPILNETLAGHAQRLQFKADRYSFLLVREGLDVTDPALPDGYSLRVFKTGEDEKAWCDVRNAAFATLKGSETPITPEELSKHMAKVGNIDGGSIMLCHTDKPVGVVRCTFDDYDNAPIVNIGPLAIIPEYQGKGLGRTLLKKSLLFSKSIGYNRAILCVNAENERAKALYVQEGFKEVEAVTCYKYSLNGS